MSWLKRLFQTKDSSPAEVEPLSIEPAKGVADSAEPSEHWSDRVKRLSAATEPTPDKPVTSLLSPAEKKPVRPSSKRPDSEEIHSMRMDRIDQMEDDARRMGLRFRLMQLSALSSTTRPTHAQRHGKLFSPAEVREWYQQDDNADKCRCSFIQIPVDEKGIPLSPKIIERARQVLEKQKAKGEGDWTKMINPEE